MHNELHPAQFHILETLRHQSSAGFAELMKPTGLLSDGFKFHIRSLVDKDLIVKYPNGNYGLTATGKEYSNTLHANRRAPAKQPKLSVLVVIPEGTASERFLVQERLRQPYMGYWGNIGGPVLWGESFEQAAARELTKQTGLTADFSVKMFVRKQDYSETDASLLEDKLFCVVVAQNLSGELTQEWPHGRNAWKAPGELEALPKVFWPTLQIPEWIAKGRHYIAGSSSYSNADY